MKLGAPFIMGISTFILIVTVVLIVIFLSRKREIVKNIKHPENSAKEDHGDYIRIISSETISPDLNLVGTIAADISKQKDTRIKMRILDVEEGGGHGDIYFYDLKTQKWENGNRPFENKIPAKFLRNLIYTWEELNGPLPKSQKRPRSISIDTIKVEVEMPQYDQVALEKLPSEIKINGSTGNSYIVNLATLTCTCPDFIKRRLCFSPTDCRRACKHIAKTIVRKKLNTKITKNKLIRAFIRKASANYEGVPPFKTILHVKINEKVRGPGEFYILLNPSKMPWVDIINFTETTYTRDGYNITEKRWAYGRNPFPDGSKAKYNIAIQQTLGSFNG